MPKEKILQADLIVKHQRLRMDEPAIRLAIKTKKKFASDISLFLEHCPARVIAVTGTRGKSTTSALIAHLLETGRPTGHVWLGGNNLVSPLTFASKVKAGDWVVLELSSWQLEELGRLSLSPAIAVWTNLMPDHLNTYPDMEAYATAKAQIFLHQKKDGLVFLPSSRSFDAWAKRARGRVVRVGTNGEARRIVDASHWSIPGEHNALNAFFAVSVVRELGMSITDIKKGLATFQGLPARQEVTAIIRGVTYVNDSSSTTPEATLAALQTYRDRPIHLIFGGSDKALVFDVVAKKISQQKIEVILLPGTAHEKIVNAFKQMGGDFQEAIDMRQAVRLATDRAKKGDVVLLSPGATSFGLFKNEFDRADAFVREVKKIKTR